MPTSKPTCKKYQTVLTLRRMPSQVRSRSAFVIALRARELGMDLGAVAKAIGCSEQYARDLMQRTKIPSVETIQAAIKGLDFGSLEVEQISTLSAHDRMRFDGRFWRKSLSALAESW